MGRNFLFAKRLAFRGHFRVTDTHALIVLWAVRVTVDRWYVSDENFLASGFGTPNGRLPRKPAPSWRSVPIKLSAGNSDFLRESRELHQWDGAVRWAVRSCG